MISEEKKNMSVNVLKIEVKARKALSAAKEIQGGAEVGISVYIFNPTLGRQKQENWSSGTVWAT